MVHVGNRSTTLWRPRSWRKRWRPIADAAHGAPRAASHRSAAIKLRMRAAPPPKGVVRARCRPLAPSTSVATHADSRSPPEQAERQQAAPWRIGRKFIAVSPLPNFFARPPLRMRAKCGFDTCWPKRKAPRQSLGGFRSARTALVQAISSSSGCEVVSCVIASSRPCRSRTTSIAEARAASAFSWFSFDCIMNWLIG